jgi:putative membrane protein
MHLPGHGANSGCIGGDARAWALPAVRAAQGLTLGAPAVQRFVLRLLITALAVLLASYLFNPLIQVDSLASALVFALVLGLLNAFLRPILLLLTLPLTLLTLGLFTLVVNGIVFWVAQLFPFGVRVQDFGGALLGALVVSVVSFVASRTLE